jgi:hypothetical protein
VEKAAERASSLHLTGSGAADRIADALSEAGVEAGA